MTDLSDSEWQLIEPHLPVAKSDDRPRKHPLREILDSIFYITAVYEIRFVIPFISYSFKCDSGIFR